MTTDLFSNSETHLSIDIPDGKLDYYPCFFNRTEAEYYFSLLLTETPWKQDKINLYGKEYLVPRLSAWYGDKGKHYEYSGIGATAIPWTNVLLSIKNAIELKTENKFNSVLINQYRNQHDSVAWHSDDEKELGVNPIIASLSLGETRQFQLKHKKLNDQKKVVPLANGSLIVMGKDTQQNWLHQVPKCKQTMQSRINLTFRFVY